MKKIVLPETPVKVYIDEAGRTTCGGVPCAVVRPEVRAEVSGDSNRQRPEEDESDDVIIVAEETAHTESILRTYNIDFRGWDLPDSLFPNFDIVGYVPDPNDPIDAAIAADAAAFTTQ